MFTERITRHYQSLSPSFRKIADMILTDHQRVAFLSASRLAKHLGVDVATVTRFSQQLGYDGYLQLIREIQEKVLDEMREARAPVTDRLEAAQDPFTLTLWRDWANLEKTISNLSADQYAAAIAALRSAKRIYLVSEGVGAGLAIAAAAYLNMLKPWAYALVQGPFDLALSLKELRPDDLVIGIGFTNYAHAATKALEYAKKVGAKSVGIITQPDCPIGGVAGILLPCSATTEGYLPSPTGAGAILFSLIHTLYVDDPELYTQKLQQFQDAYADLTAGVAHDEEVLEDLIMRP